MYVAEVPNRDSPPAFLLRESYRENGKVKNRTLANISSWPRPRIDALRRLLRGELDDVAVCGSTMGAALRGVYVLEKIGGQACGGFGLGERRTWEVRVFVALGAAAA